MAFESIMVPYNASDPTARFLSSSCLDFLLIELVPMAYRVTNDLEARNRSHAAIAISPPDAMVEPVGGQKKEEGREEGKREDGEDDEDDDVDDEDDYVDESAAGDDGRGRAKKSARGGGGRAGSGRSKPVPPRGAEMGGPAEGYPPMDEDEERDAVFNRLERLGYRVGQGLAERFSRDRSRFNDTLDVIRFLCKDFWTLVFRKQVDNLKTNHRGVFVLTDNSFRPFSRMSTEPGGHAVLRAQPFLWFPCGIVRGVLAGLRIDATVQAETHELPGAVFQIKTIPPKQ